MTVKYFDAELCRPSPAFAGPQGVGVRWPWASAPQAGAVIDLTKMKIMKFTPIAAAAAPLRACSRAIGVAFSLAAAVHAGQVSFSTKTPTLGPNDIANLTGANDHTDNVSEGDHNATYIADDRPIQGQTFTTGTNSAGYQLRAVTLREVKHDTYALVPDLKYTVRITKPSSNALEVLATETAEAAAQIPGNITSIADGAEMGSGSGRFVTFALEKPVMLKPNTIYGFDLGGGTERHYWQTDGTASNVYPGGEAYSSGQAGVGSLTRTSRRGDRVFVVALTPANARGGRQAKAAPEKETSKQ